MNGDVDSVSLSPFCCFSLPSLDRLTPGMFAFSLDITQVVVVERLWTGTSDNLSMRKKKASEMSWQTE